MQYSSLSEVICVSVFQPTFWIFCMKKLDVLTVVFKVQTTCRCQISWLSEWEMVEFVY